MSHPQHPYGAAPPIIVVEPFPSAPSILPPGAAPAPSVPQLSTYQPSSHPFPCGGGPPSHALPQAPPPAAAAFPLPSSPSLPTPGLPNLPAYTQGNWRSAAEQEKDAYLSRSSTSDEGHWADAQQNANANTNVNSYRGKAPPAILVPPKAAFASPAASPMSPISLKKAMEFGDVSSVKNGYGGTEKEIGRGGAEVRKSGLDWARFSTMLHSQEGKESDWLKSKTRSSKRWFYLGWIGSILVLIAIAAALAYHFTHKSGDTEPKVPSLGGLNDKNVTAESLSSSRLSASSTGRSSSSYSSLLHKLSTTATTAAATTTSSAAAVEEEEDEVEETSTSAARRTTTTTSAAARTTTTTTTSSAAAETTTSSSARAATTTTTTSAARSTTTTAARTSATEIADAERRLKKRFGTWEGIEWKIPGSLLGGGERKKEKKRSGNWREIEFSSPVERHGREKRAAKGARRHD
ncbi:hypothetical protein JCM8547_004658 [Rhodosporidiobolus lusitaniae]